MIVEGHERSFAGLPEKPSRQVQDEKLNRPTQQRRANCESRTDRGQKHQVALLQPTFLARRLHGQRNRSRGRIAVAINIDDYALRF
jgi:hypothetical protein